MTYKQFCDEVEKRGWSDAQIRCDERPCGDLLAFMDEVGQDYERYVMRRISKGNVVKS